MPIRYDTTPVAAASGIRYDTTPVAGNNDLPNDKSSVIGAVARGAERSAIPTLGGFAGAEALAPIGAGLGSLAGPLGTAAGGVGGAIIGALGGGNLAAAGQNAVLNANPDMANAIGLGADQQEADESEHPIASFVGGALPQAALLRPSGGVFDLLKAGEAGGAARAGVIGGAILQGGVEAGQEYASDGKIDPTKVALSAAAGALLNKPTKLGETIGETARSPAYAAMTPAMRAAVDASNGRSSSSGDGGMAAAEAPTDDTAVRPGSNLLALPAPTPQPAAEEVGQGSTRAPPNPTPLLTDQVGKQPLYADDEGNVGATPGHTPQPQLTGPPPEPAPEEVGQGSTRAPPNPTAQLTDQPATATPPNATPLALPNPDAPIDAHFEDVGQGSSRAPPNPTPPQPDTPLALPDLRGATPIAGEPPSIQNYSTNDILQRLRAANPKADGTPGPTNQLTIKLANSLSRALSAGDIHTADTIAQSNLARVTADEFAGSKRETNTVLAAVNEVESFKQQMAATEASKAPAPIVPVDPAAHAAEPVAAPGGPTPMPEAAPQAQLDLTPAHLDPEATPADAYTQGHRDALLSGILDKPGNETPTTDFLAQLRSKGHDDAIQPQEAERIAQYEQGKVAAEAPAAPGDEHGNEAPAEAEQQTAPVPEPGEGVQGPPAEEGGGRQVAGPEAGEAGQEPVPGRDVGTPPHLDADEIKAAGVVSDRIDQLFRDKQISAAERARLKIVQEGVGGQMPSSAEMHSRIDDYLSAKSETAGPADFKQAPPKEVKAPDGSTLARAGALGQPAPGGGKIDEVVKAARSYLDRMGLHQVGLKLEQHLADGNLGTYGHQMISLAMHQTGDSLADSLHHEMIHAMRDLGMFSKEEWGTLVDAANADTAHSADVESRYPDVKGEQLDEEKVAEMFAKSFDKPPATFVGKMIRKLKGFLGAIKSAFTKTGASADDIMDRIKSGEIGNRQEGIARPTAEDAPVMARRTTAEIAGLKPGEPVPEKEAMHVTASDILNGFGGAVRRVAMNLETMHQMATDLRHSPIANEADRIADNLNQSAQHKADMLAQGSHVQDDWSKLPKADHDAVDKALFAATRAGVDVHKAGAKGPEVDTYKALSPAAQKVYDGALAHMSAQRDQALKMFTDAIQAGNGSDAEKAADIEAKSKALSREAYFPLFRIGDYTNVATKPEFFQSKGAVDNAKADLAKVRADDTSTPEQREAALATYKEAVAAHEVSVDKNYIRTQHESHAEQIAAARAQEAAGYTVDQMRTKKFNGAVHGPATALLSRLDEMLAADTAAHPDRAAGNAGLQRMAHEVAHTMLPESSGLRTVMQRHGAGIAGYHTDAMRVFSNVSRRNAGFLAQMTSGEKLRQGLAAIETKLNALPAGTDRVKLDEFSQQMNKNYAAMGKYSEQPVQTALTNGAYAWFLGLSPSFTVSHLIQTPLVTAPMLGAHFPAGRVAGELLRAAGEVTKSIGHLKEGYETTWGSTPMEKAAVRYAMEHATITSTHSDQFLGAGDKSTPHGAIGQRVMKVATFFPHYTEKANRVGTLLAATRLAASHPKVAARLEAGLSDARWATMKEDQPWLAGFTKQQAAIMKFADKITTDSHVDYTAENMSHIMQPGVMPMGKLMFQFQKYQQAMIYQLARNAVDSFDKNLSGDEQWVARKTLAGIVGSHTLMTGLMGFPMYGAAAVGANIYHKLFGDKDDPFDSDDRFRSMLNEHLGKDAGDVAARGLLYAPGLRDVLPGDVTDRLGMGDLLTASTAADGSIDKQSLVAYLGSTMGGPVASLLTNVMSAGIEHSQGDNWKAAEDLMPKVMRDFSRTGRYMMQGVTTSSNNPVVKPGELTGFDLAAQFFGWTPQKVEDAYANRMAVQDAKAELDARRKVLLKEYTDATTGGDQDKANALRDKIQAYNDEQLSRGVITERITASDMLRSVQTRRLAAIRLNNGVAMSPKDRGLINEYSVNPTP